jgi:hypothetical protein
VLEKVTPVNTDGTTGTPEVNAKGSITLTVKVGERVASKVKTTGTVGDLIVPMMTNIGPAKVIELRPPTAQANQIIEWSILPVDLDIVHPATGELAEGREDSSSKWVEAHTGGLIALRRNENTPMTKLVLRASSGLPSDASFRVKWTETLSTARVKVWADEARTQLVISLQTEFPTSTDTTLFIEGIKRGIGEDLKFTQQVKAGGSWVDGDSVSTTVVHAEIPVVLRAFIPHKWTSGEGPGVPVSLTELSDTIGGNRQNYSVESYETEPEFKITQKLVMTPYRELHENTDIISERRKKPTEFSHYYERAEDIPLSDQGLNFGETFVPGATPNWSFRAPEPEAEYKDAGRIGQESYITASLSGSPGGWALDGLMPNIDFEFVIKMERMETGLVPYMRVTVDVTQNQYPAYEAVIGNANGTYEHVYKVKPPASTLPGPNSLNTDQTGTGGPLDIH